MKNPMLRCILLTAGAPPAPAPTSAPAPVPVPAPAPVPSSKPAKPRPSSKPAKPHPSSKPAKPHPSSKPAKPRPSPKPTPKPTRPTKALSIVADFLATSESAEDEELIRNFEWKFFATQYGHAVGCRTDYAVSVRQKRVLYPDTSFPGGSFDLILFGESCTYKNIGHNAGKLFCGGNKQISCTSDPANHSAGLGVTNPLPFDPLDKSPLSWIPGVVVTTPMELKNSGQYDCGRFHRVPMFTCAWW
ncbi:hypothetical protein BDW02DRAFT_567795 [Decorospora gaudefroyi]|uniref:Uncharacterized protein n=1 Tax=Decorospora gaudefroyi TaxID=184978 RepID=A0A6A5KEG2_9PLEO|nr:hypothetical protein BDW02DRAFT_567795 [Decorospora gaudefroyi]